MLCALPASGARVCVSRRYRNFTGQIRFNSEHNLRYGKKHSPPPPCGQVFDVKRGWFRLHKSLHTCNRVYLDTYWCSGMIGSKTVTTWAPRTKEVVWPWNILYLSSTRKPCLKREIKNNQSRMQSGNPALGTKPPARYFTCTTTKAAWAALAHF